MDDGIGRILQALEDKGIADDTLVLFFSDNGGHVGTGASNDPLRGQKGQLLEGGIRVPAAIRWPRGLRSGRRVNTIMGYIDVFPTLQRISGVSEYTGKALDGLDMLDVFRGEPHAPARDWYSYLGSDEQEQLSITTADWKLIRLGPTILRESTADKVSIGLFRIKDDPNETKDLSEAHREVVRDLLGRLRTFRSLRPEGGVTPSVLPPEGWEPPKEWRIPEM